jgi:TonB family protein
VLRGTFRATAVAAGLFLFAGPAAAQTLREVMVPAVDYPAGVRPGAQEFRVIVAYEVDDSGHVFRCRVARGSGEPALDSESCLILQTRARIRPDPATRSGRLLFRWGLAAETIPVLHRRGDPLYYALYQMLTADDYPRSSLANDESGTVGFEVDVSPTGRPTACRVTNSSTFEGLDRQTCSLVMTRGIFIPSVGPDGPRAGTTYGRLTWRLP